MNNDNSSDEHIGHIYMCDDVVDGDNDDDDMCTQKSTYLYSYSLLHLSISLTQFPPIGFVKFCAHTVITQLGDNRDVSHTELELPNGSGIPNKNKKEFKRN
jgi:hypothetical protein